MPRFRDLAWVSLSAVLYVLCFPEWDISPLVWIALIPWISVQHRHRSMKSVLLLSAWLSLWVSVGGFHWVMHSLKEFGGLPTWLCLLGLILFSLVNQPQFYLYPILRKILVKRCDLKPSTGRIFLLALAYTACDFVVPKLFRDTFGHAFLGLPHLVQAADLGGAYVLTLLPLLFSELVVSVLHDSPPKAWRKRWREIASVLLTLAAFEGYGIWRLKDIRSKMDHAPSHVQMAAIQANIGDIDKIAFETGNLIAAERIVNTYLRLSEEALLHEPKPALIVWPETAYPALFRQSVGISDLNRERKIDEFVMKSKTPLLFGGYSHERNKDFNSLFILSTEQYRVYRKNILLPFGEFVPIIGDLPFMERFFPQIGNFGRGVGPEAISIRLADNQLILFAPVICYEALFPWYTRASAREDNQVILNITNDSWFGPKSEPHLHLALTVFRSIETRLPQARATNTGISSLILPDGSFSRGPIGEETILHWNIPILDTKKLWSLHRAWGEWFGPFAGCVVLGFILLHEMSNRRKRRKSKD